MSDTRWCPSCGDEFRAGIERCPDCGVDLQAAQPPAHAPSGSGPKVSLTGPFSDDDDPVELGRFGPIEAQSIAALLRSGGIPATLREISPFTGQAGPALGFAEGSGVLVRRADLDVAEALVRQSDDGTFTDEDLAAQAEAAAGTDFGNGAVV